MSVENPVQDEVFTVRIYKSIAGYAWANTYEIQTTDPFEGLTGLTSAAIAIVDAERAFHLTEVRFNRVVVSTYVPDSTTYNPQSFTTLTLDVNGRRNVSNVHRLPLTTCVFARFNASTGRTGKRFYRGCLTEPDVDGVLTAHFIDPSLRDQIDAALSQVIGTFRPGIRMVLARGRPNPTNVRVVDSVTIAELTTNKKLNNRYFDVRDR